MRPEFKSNDKSVKAMRQERSFARREASVLQQQLAEEQRVARDVTERSAESLEAARRAFGAWESRSKKLRIQMRSYMICLFFLYNIYIYIVSFDTEM